MNAASNYKQIRLMAQMSGKSFQELKAHFDSKEKPDSTPAKTLKAVSSAPKTATA